MIDYVKESFGSRLKSTIKSALINICPVQHKGYDMGKISLTNNPGFPVVTVVLTTPWVLRVLVETVKAKLQLYGT